MLLRINEIDNPVAFDAAGEVLDILRAVTSGWVFRPVPTVSPAQIRVSGTGRGYRIESAFRSRAVEEATAVSAACSLIVDLIDATVDARADMLCLHAGAAEFGEGLVVFPSRRRAGKSTLIARLASLGVRSFADDVLPLCATAEGIEGQAFGVASRLRLPLPLGMDPGFLRFCDERCGPQDRYYRYLRPSPGTLAPHGATAPISAFVFLDRVAEHEAPSLSRADLSLAIEALLLQNFGIAASASEIFGRFERMLGKAGVYVLRYSSLDAAARLLIDAFGAGQVEALLQRGEAAIALPPLERTATGIGPSGDLPLCRATGAEVRELAGRRFLLDNDNGAIFALDGIGGAIWSLLAEPISPDEIIGILSAAFDGVPPDIIRRDVGTFLDALAARGLVRARAGTGPDDMAPTRTGLPGA